MKALGVFGIAIATLMLLGQSALGQSWTDPLMSELLRATTHSDKATLSMIAERVNQQSSPKERWIGVLSSGVLAQKSGRPAKSAAIFDSLVKTCPKNLPLLMALARKHQCVNATDMMKYPLAVQFADQGLALLDTSIDLELSSELLSVKAEALIELTDYSAALSLLNKAHDLADKAQHPRGKSMALLAMGNILFRQKRYPDALVRYEQAIEALRSDMQDVIAIRSVSNMAAAAVMSKNYDAAIQLLDSIIIQLGSRDPLVRSRCWASKSYVSNMRKDYSMALDQLIMAEVIADSNLLRDDKAKFKQQRANILWRKGEQRDALALNLEALRLADSCMNPVLTCEIHKKLSNWYRDLDDYSSAYMHQEAYGEINDSLNVARYSDGLAYGEVLFETERKERRIAEQDQAIILADEKDRRRSLQRNIALGSTLVLIVLAILLWRALQARRKLANQELELHTQRVDELMHTNELTAMNSMIEGQEKERDRVAKDLHDRLGSMLSAIKHQLGAVEIDVQQVKKDQGTQYSKMHTMLDEAVGEVRRISHDMITVALSRFGLTKALEDLCDSVRVKGKLEVELQLFGLEQRMERSMEIAVYRIVQEAISNVLKHAKATELSVDVTRGPGRISVIVHDNGKGFDPEIPSTGIGMENMRNRAMAIGAVLRVDSGMGNGTTVSVEGPVVE